MTEFLNRIKTRFGTHFYSSYKYLLIGVLCFILDFYTLMFLVKYTKMFYLLASGIGYIVGVIVNYFFCIKWIFSERIHQKNWKLEFGFFFLIEIIALIFMSSSLFILKGFLRIDLALSKVIANILTAIWNYIMKYRLLFNKENV